MHYNLIISLKRSFCISMQKRFKWNSSIVWIMFGKSARYNFDVLDLLRSAKEVLILESQNAGNYCNLLHTQFFTNAGYSCMHWIVLKSIMPLTWMTWMLLLQCVFLFQILDTMPSCDELQARTMSPFGILSSSQETISTFLQVPLKKHASIFALCLVKCNELASIYFSIAFLVNASKKARQNNTQEVKSQVIMFQQ